MSSVLGVTSPLRGMSIVGVGCVCAASDRQWMEANDYPFHTKRCMRCQRVWHQCPLHGADVAGWPKYNETVCSCNHNWMPPSSGCPACGQRQARMPFEGYSTRICAQCGATYHVCPVDGKSVDGPGYPLSAREQTMCQCHEKPSFLGKQWSSPFIK